MLFNLDENASAAATVSIANTSKTTFSASTLMYGKAQYDQSRNGDWTGPVLQTLGAVNVPVAITLPAWSMTVLKLQ
jgi:hypothetical protein